MFEIHMVVPMKQQALARLGVPPTEWDVMAVGTDEFLGVIEWFEDGYMFTDSFGKQTAYTDDQSMPEIFQEVTRLFSPEVVH